MTVRLRFAPSPTGYLHIGGARTALFNWLYARHAGGKFILRIEDTDQSRTIADAQAEQMAALRWLGLDWDEGPDIGGDFGPYVQSERVHLYQEWANWLLENDFAYRCFATAEELTAMREEQKAKGLPLGYDRRYRDFDPATAEQWAAEGKPHVIRFKMPLEGSTTMHDVVRGDITFENNQLTDLVLLKSDGFPTYHLANVIDDHLMQITHIMRADEWVNTGPLHINIYRALGWDVPVYVHLPVVLSPSGKGKLSKRDQAFNDGDTQVLVQVREFREAGYLPEAVTNFLTNIGWSFGDDREIFSTEEAIAQFNLESINPAPTKLPYAKLDWLNGQYIQELAPEALAQAIAPFLDAQGWDVDLDTLVLVAPPISVRLKRLAEAVDWLRFLYEQAPLAVPAAQLTHKKMPTEMAIEGFTQARDYVLNPENPYDLEALGEEMRRIGEAVTDNGKAGPFLGTMRFVVTGEPVSPPLFESMLALG
ncbi:MAG: glutamate--tRNA ligase, partial [Anaerolineales bacterium]|nr:glutamate--tRNA ligase [Anaerolineales bacterium]